MIRTMHKCITSHHENEARLAVKCSIKGTKFISHSNRTNLFISRFQSFMSDAETEENEIHWNLNFLKFTNCLGGQEFRRKRNDRVCIEGKYVNAYHRKFKAEIEKKLIRPHNCAIIQNGATSPPELWLGECCESVSLIDVKQVWCVTALIISYDKVRIGWWSIPLFLSPQRIIFKNCITRYQGIFYKPFQKPISIWKV